MKKRRLLIIILLVTFVLSGCGTGSNKKHLERTEFLMNTIVKIDLYGREDDAIMDKVYDRLFEIEKIMSKTIKDSDVSRINEKAGKEVEVRDETYYVLEKAISQARNTEASFDPTIGPLVNLWDINESEEDRDWIPKESEIEDAKKLVNYEGLELLGGNMVRLTRKDMELDLGGIVKGFATDEIVKLLKEENVDSAMIDLGGDLYAYGKKVDGSPWKIGIQDPSIEEQDYMGILSITDKSVVTSGNYERYFELDGEVYHHIIDGKTGYPAKNELASVTTISDYGIDSDSYATAFYILGLNRSLDLLNRLEGVDGILISKDKKVYITEGIRDKFQLRDNNSGFTIMD